MISKTIMMTGLALAAAFSGSAQTLMPRTSSSVFGPVSLATGRSVTMCVSRFYCDGSVRQSGDGSVRQMCDGSVRITGAFLDANTGRTLPGAQQVQLKAGETACFTNTAIDGSRMVNGVVQLVLTDLSMGSLLADKFLASTAQVSEGGTVEHSTGGGGGAGRTLFVVPAVNLPFVGLSLP